MNTTEALLHQGAGTPLQPWLVGGAAILATVGVYAVAKKPKIDERLYGESLLPYSHDIAEVLTGEHEAIVVGGLAIDAFNHPSSVIDADARTITVSPDFESPLLRSNGTVRDYDILVFDKDEQGRFTRIPDDERTNLKRQLVTAASDRAQQLGHPTPEMSLFSFDTHANLVHSATVVSADGTLYLEHGYVQQPLPDSSMQTWTLQLPDGAQVSVLNPWEQYWRSVVRFCSGIKVKDTEKLDTMLQKLRSTEGLAEQEKSPLNLAYQIFDGRMRFQNSAESVVETFYLDERNIAKMAKLSTLALASTVIGIGQQSKAINRIVQGAPTFFDRFVSSK